MLTKTYITVVLNNYITPKDPHMTLEIIGGIFSVCKLEKLPSALPDTNFIFFARTAGVLCAFAASWTFRSSASSPISHPCSRGGR